MTADTRLKKLLAMEDGIKKRTKLFEFACHVMPHSQLWQSAYDEWKRLNAIKFN